MQNRAMSYMVAICNSPIQDEVCPAAPGGRSVFVIIMSQTGKSKEYGVKGTKYPYSFWNARPNLYHLWCSSSIRSAP